MKSFAKMRTKRLFFVRFISEEKNIFNFFKIMSQTPFFCTL